MSLTGAMPWYFWVLWSGIGFIVILRWTIKSSKGDPVLFRLGGFLMAIACMIVVIDNLCKVDVIKETKLYTLNLLIFKPLSMPVVILTGISLIIGIVQKSHRPDFDPVKRREVIMYMYALLATAIFVATIFGGVYIYSHFIKSSL